MIENYDRLAHKPKINGHELKGNSSFDEIDPQKQFTRSQVYSANRNDMYAVLSTKITKTDAQAQFQKYRDDIEGINSRIDDLKKKDPLKLDVQEIPDDVIDSILEDMG